MRFGLRSGSVCGCEWGAGGWGSNWLPEGWYFMNWVGWGAPQSYPDIGDVHTDRYTHTCIPNLGIAVVQYLGVAQLYLMLRSGQTQLFMQLSVY